MISFSFPAALLLGLVILKNSAAETTHFIGTHLVIFGGIAQLAAILDAIVYFQRRQNGYEKEAKQYEDICQNNQTERSKIPQYQTGLETKQAELQRLSEQLRKSQQLRSDVYDANIIPAEYRDIHAAYYLYDYFSSCGENDLDKIIQTLHLDEISQKSDRLIAQKEEMLLNQRYQTAVQELQNPSETERHRGELQQLAELEQNQELRLACQSMIAKHQQVTDSFSEIDYFQQK
ncbi:MAG: hypothetical protein KBT45_03315 [Bacteroidales bacterium]|nr:hypothetical protein [Candidatus Colimorpha pelethequi]